jgi:2'-5' RNA ligase
MHHDHRIRYFVAIRPEARVALLAGRVRDTLPLRSRVDDHRLHVTLGIVAEMDDPSDRIGAAVEAALADHGLIGCPIALGVLEAGDGIAKLLPVGSVAELKALQAGTFDKLAHRGIAFRRPENFRPHMTLGYGLGFSARRKIEPIGWPASEILLIESWIGKHVHRTVARWPLAVPAQRCFDFA